MSKKILLFLKNYENSKEIFSEYLKIFSEKGFQTKVFDFTQNYCSRNKISYFFSIIKTINNFQPDYVYVGDELFSKNILYIILIRKLFYKKFLIMSLVASQYLPRKIGFLTRNIDVLFCRNRKELEKIKLMPEFRNYAGLRQIYLGVPEKFYYKTENSREYIYKFVLGIGDLYSQFSAKHILCFSGRMCPEKGVLYILECLKELPDNFALIIAGKEEDEEYKQKISDFIVNNRLDARVLFINNLESEKVGYIYNISDLVIVPTTNRHNNFQELFGSVIAEAMLSGTLVAGSDNGSIPEILGRKEFIFEQNNYKDLLKIIKYTFSLPSYEKERIIVENYNLASEKYSALAFVQTIINCINEK